MPACAAAARSSQSPWIEGRVAERRADAPAVDVLAESARRPPPPCACPPSCRAGSRPCPRASRSLKLKRLARADADARELLADLLSPPAAAGANCSAKSRYSKKFCLDEVLVELRKVDRRRGGRRRLASGRRKRLHLVAGLHLLHVVDVGRRRRAACGRRPSENCVVERNTFLMPAGVSPFQSGPTTR